MRSASLSLGNNNSYRTCAITNPFRNACGTLPNHRVIVAASCERVHAADFWNLREVVKGVLWATDYDSAADSDDDASRRTPTQMAKEAQVGW